MMLISQLPQTVSPLTPEQTDQFSQLLSSMTPVQQAWISGYLAANAQTGTVAAVGAPQAPAEAATWTILYGSQTGNAKHVASDLAAAADAQSLSVKLVNMADYKPAQLKNEKYLTIVTATYGEGEPPEGAAKLHAFLASKKAPRLDGVKVAVLGLGDSSYEQFNQTAIDFDERLTALGAEVLIDRVLLDVDYDEQAADWQEQAVSSFAPLLKAQAPADAIPVPGRADFGAAPAQYTKKNPFEAEVSVVQKITGRDSMRDVRHVELSLEGSGITYQPGDSLGVYFQNDPAEVDDILTLLKADPTAPVQISDAKKPLRDALIEDMELTQSYPGFITAFAEATGNTALTELAADRTQLRAYLEGRQTLDIVREHAAPIEAQTLISALRKMQPRLYSISSSQAEVEDEVHLTVAVNEWDAFDHHHLGGCSGHLGRRSAEGDTLRVFVEANDGFRLPSDPDTPVIMIGPGTGIAPFRAFLQEREAQEATGKNWLFFGNPNFTQDFLYQTELQSYLKSGVLNRLDVAFSRDQAQKIYVQDRIIEHSAEVFDWLESGAHVYVCGDANRMARDVNSALLKVLRVAGDLSDDQAQDYLGHLRDSRRYQRDVY